MNDQPPTNPPWWYWTIADLALIWASLRILQIVPMLNADMPEPWWAETGYVTGQIATFAGVAALLFWFSTTSLRRNWLRPTVKRAID